MALEWKRLGELVTARRESLRMTREELAGEARVSSRVISDVEHHRRSNFDRISLLRIAHALNWDERSIGRILNGGEPAERQPDPPGLTRLHPLVAELHFMLAADSPLTQVERDNLEQLLDLLLQRHRADMHRERG